MSKVIGNLTKVMALLIGVPAAALFAYDMIAVRPHLAEIRDALVQANPEDSSPPQIIRDLIDANSGSPAPYTTRLVTSLVYSDMTQSQWHIREALWRILLPMHFADSEFYGLYATLAYNGTDNGLSNFALRQYGQPLSHLSPTQAAATVAVTHAPTLYIHDPDRLAQRASALLDKAGHAP